VVWKAEEERKILIGRPISNTTVYIVDEQENLCGIGIPGEMWIGGAGVARGYLHLPEQTSERFGEDPWRPGERLYKTGDRARWLADGNIEYLGRNDEQVKINGYRIELGEVEHALTRNNLIKTAVVLPKETKDGNTELVAYLVADEPLNIPAVKAQLNSFLPVYMVPVSYVQLDQIPVTINGKTDKKSLLQLFENTRLNTSAEYIAPGNDTENKLIEIWQDVLGREHIGINDNFFDLGGNSLKIIRLNKKVNTLFKRNDSITVFFLYPTVHQFAKYINDQSVDNQLPDDLIDSAVANLENSLSAFENLNVNDVK
jgi:acyl carrier protein